MLQAMVARFNQEAATIDLPAAAQAAHLTPGQVITVASIMEAEAGNPKYYRQVAEVIYNRLNLGMKLGLDSTVNYALHRFGVHLTVSQLHVNSPYNTFIHTGLPPGPIDSPGDAAIEAALHPGPRQPALLRDREPEDRPHQVHQQSRPSSSSSSPSASATTRAEAAGMRAAVLGSPVSHSLSPALHRAAYQALGPGGLDLRRDRVRRGAAARAARRAAARTGPACP